MRFHLLLINIFALVYAWQAELSVCLFPDDRGIPEKRCINSCIGDVSDTDKNTGTGNGTNRVLGISLTRLLVYTSKYLVRRDKNQRYWERYLGGSTAFGTCLKLYDRGWSYGI